MILYGRKGNAIEIYKVNKDENGLKEFRKKEMQKINKHDRVVDCYAYHVGMSCGEIDSQALFGDWTRTKLKEKELDKIIIEESSIKRDRTNNDLNDYYLNVLRSTFKSDDEIVECELIRCGDIPSPKNMDFFREFHNSRYFETLQQYYDGQFSDKLVARIHYLKTIRYFLLTAPKYRKDTIQPHLCTYFNYVMSNIIELPESLYLLQLLEQEKFELLKEKGMYEEIDISKLLDFYSLTQIDERSLEDFQKMDLSGITQNGYSKAISKCRTDVYILKLLKK